MQKKRKRIMIAISVILMLCIIFNQVALAASLKKGSSGQQVKEVQNRLKRWGYYDGAIDGIYGSKTEAAVKRFQKANGLTADGVVGTQTAKAMGISGIASSGTASSSGNSGNDVYLLARLIHGEARGEPYKGQVAVGAIVLNRVNSSSFPNSIAGVIYQNGAFSVVADGQINMSPDQSSVKAAKDALNGWDPTNGCLYYYNPAKTSNSWMLSKPISLVIGEHVFCR